MLYKIEIVFIFYWFLSLVGLGNGEGFYFLTDKVLSPGGKDVVAAFGDFDADKMTDVFVVNHEGQSLDVLLQQDEKQFVRRTLIEKSPENKIISGVMLGDFNGDVLMDVLITWKTINGDNSLSISIFYSDGNTLKRYPATNFTKNFRDQPLLFDFDGDMTADFLVEVTPGNSMVYRSDINGNFSAIPFGGRVKPAAFTVPHSNAFIDMNQDLNADLVLTTESGYEVWLKEEGEFHLSETYNLTQNFAYVGQSTFADFNLDGAPDQLVPVCSARDNNGCKDSSLWLRSKGQWYEVNKEFKFAATADQGELVWRFVPPGSQPLGGHTNYSLPATARVGDYNYDGYPDLLLVMAAKDGPTWHQRAFLFKNVACDTPDCSPFGRTFQMDDQKPSSIDQVLLGTFYDLFEDGTLDVILVDISKHPELRILKNDLAADACFIKVLCVSGLCADGNCPHNTKPYGVNIPGPSFTYTTTRTDGSRQTSQAYQLPQSAHFPLQLPYNLLGLGPTPNFLETLSAGIPAPEKPRTKQWREIIPNSQMIVIPEPITKPSQWKLKLFVTPSKMVYYTSAALAGTCGLVAIIVGILHWKEKREDFEEKKQEAQKFHFDAM